MDEVIAFNADALKRIDREIKELKKKIKVTEDSIDNQNNEKKTEFKMMKKRCRFYKANLESGLG